MSRTLFNLIKYFYQYNNIFLTYNSLSKFCSGEVTGNILIWVFTLFNIMLILFFCFSNFWMHWSYTLHIFRKKKDGQNRIPFPKYGRKLFTVSLKIGFIGSFIFTSCHILIKIFLLQSPNAQFVLFLFKKYQINRSKFTEKQFNFNLK